MATITIDEKTFQSLRAGAEARGLSLEAFLEQLASADHSSSSAVTAVQCVREFDLALDELFSTQTPDPPEDRSSYSRDDIYFDHD